MPSSSSGGARGTGRGPECVALPSRSPATPPRRQEIRVLAWKHVDLKVGAVELAADEGTQARPWQVIPLVKPASTPFSSAWIAQGRPKEGKVWPPRHSIGLHEDPALRAWFGFPAGEGTLRSPRGGHIGDRRLR